MSWRTITITAVGAAALAAVATALVLYEPEAGTATRDPDAQYTLAAADFSDPHQVTLTIHPSEPTVITAPTAGTVTANRCTTGDALTSGGVIGEVDQQPVIVLRTAAPLFRDLTGGESGADVRGVQKALRALGYDAPSTGSYDWLTKASVNSFLKDRGVVVDAGEWGVLPLRLIAWVASDEDGSVSGCIARKGDRIESGDPLLTLLTDPGVIDVSDVEVVVDGDRTLRVGETVVPVAETPLRDPEVVTAILTTPEGSAAARRDEKTLAATFELADPIHAYPVPPSALFGIDGPRACISDKGAVHRVAIPASRLGLSYVVFDGPAPTAADVFPDRTLVCG